MAPEITLQTAQPTDAETLADISRRSFDSDQDLGAPVPGGPPGYDDPNWQRRMMKAGDYYAVIADGSLVGGAIVFDKGGGEVEVGRIFIDPSHARLGIGHRAMGLVMERYPHARRWILDTPVWNPRTRAFYEGLGFTRYGRLVLDDGFELVLYERRTDALF